MILVSEPFFIVTERCRYAWKGSRWIRNPLLSSFGNKWGWSSAAFGDEAAREVRFGVHRVCAVDLWWQKLFHFELPIIFKPVLSWFRFTGESLKSLCLRNYVVITLMSLTLLSAPVLRCHCRSISHLGDLAYKWGVMCVAPTMICHSLTPHPSLHSTLLMWCVLVTHLNEQSRNAWVSQIIDIVLEHCFWPYLIFKGCPDILFGNYIHQLLWPVHTESIATNFPSKLLGNHHNAWYVRSLPLFQHHQLYPDDAKECEVSVILWGRC